MNSSKKPHLPSIGMTHPGMSGKNNEDRYGIFTHSLKDKTPSIFAILADGVGGKQAGEIAAETAIEIFQAVVGSSDGSDPVGTMKQAYTEASRTIGRQAGESAELKGMGTTATCVWVLGDRVYGMNVGNSRLYLLRSGRLQQISIDHSWIQEAMDLGAITPEQARNHPNSHVITRYLGSDKMVPDSRLRFKPDESDEEMEANQGFQLQPGDLLFLCSDGLSDVVDDPEIEKELQREDMQQALSNLTDLANAAGGPDNITTISIRFPDPQQVQKAGRGSIARLLVYLVSGGILAAVVTYWWLFLR